MIRIDNLSVAIASLYALVYVILIQFEATFKIGFIMLMFAPFVLVGMVYAVLKYGRYDGRELGDDEYGYQDKPTKV